MGLGTRHNRDMVMSELRRRAYVAGFLSLLVPGLGQMYGGRGRRGAAILVGAIVIGNLNLLFLLAWSIASLDQSSGWVYWLPRAGHDVAAVWSIVYWFWAVFDAFRLVSRKAEV